ncbi:hypothetical protein Ciccas_000379 [Cichlidogyrus casuarinus]|uniref:Uncharacterized protein n=1 Tax=Cichlidogyrus casuarinus TaxID=1844966 RepID=A0ABD2QN21_9PLAT
MQRFLEREKRPPPRDDSRLDCVLTGITFCSPTPVMPKAKKEERPNKLPLIKKRPIIRANRITSCIGKNFNCTLDQEPKMILNRKSKTVEPIARCNSRSSRSTNDDPILAPTTSLSEVTNDETPDEQLSPFHNIYFRYLRRVVDGWTRIQRTGTIQSGRLKRRRSSTALTSAEMLTARHEKILVDGATLESAVLTSLDEPLEKNWDNLFFGGHKYCASYEIKCPDFEKLPFYATLQTLHESLRERFHSNSFMQYEWPKLSHDQLQSMSIPFSMPIQLIAKHLCAQGLKQSDLPYFIKVTFV